MGEGLNRWGILGILLIASGSYFLGLGPGHRRFWDPIKALARETGARLMLLVAAIYSVTAALFKLAILHSDPAFFGVAYPLTAIGLMTGRLSLEPRNGPCRPCRPATAGGWRRDSCFALSTLSLANGVKLAPVTYLVAVKRLSLLISVALGGMWLRERPFLPRLLAAGPDVRRGGADYFKRVSSEQKAVSSKGRARL